MADKNDKQWNQQDLDRGQKSDMSQGGFNRQEQGLGGGLDQLDSEQDIGGIGQDQYGSQGKQGYDEDYGNRKVGGDTFGQDMDRTQGQVGGQSDLGDQDIGRQGQGFGQQRSWDQRDIGQNQSSGSQNYGADTGRVSGNTYGSDVSSQRGDGMRNRDVSIDKGGAGGFASGAAPRPELDSDDDIELGDFDEDSSDFNKKSGYTKGSQISGLNKGGKKDQY